MFIVCVAACPIGVAHTYMAAEALKREGEQRKLEIKVETQGSMGIDNALTQEDIERADVAIVASDIAIEGRDRFDNLPVLECSVAMPIKHINRLFDTLFDELEKYESDKE